VEKSFLEKGNRQQELWNLREDGIEEDEVEKEEDVVEALIVDDDSA
jgi:hypothetical protein